MFNFCLVPMAQRINITEIMFADQAHLAKMHYSRHCRRLFTVGLLLCALGLEAQNHKKSPVVKVMDPLATQFFRPNPKRVTAMVHTGIQRVTGEKNSSTGWRSMFTLKDVIGIKVNARLGTLSGTRPAVVNAVIEGLLQSGFSASQIIIWDKHLHELKQAGYMKFTQKYGVKISGAQDSGYDEWNSYKLEAFAWKPQPGDHLYGKVKYSNISHVSKLVTQELTAIISIHSPIFIPRRGVSGHLTELALASADNMQRFDYSYLHYRSAVVDLCDRIAFSHTLIPENFLKELETLKTDRTDSAQKLSLFPVDQTQSFFYFEELTDKALPADMAFRQAYQAAKKTKTPKEIRILTDTLAWNQLVLPEGRTVINLNAWQDGMAAHTKLRFHITDALLCQYNQGQQSRPDYAAATNELWFSPDPLALDVLAHQLIEELRRSANLPKGTNPEVLHRDANKKFLGNAYKEDMNIKSITMTAAGSGENRE